MGLKRTDEFRKDAVRIALTSGLTRNWPGTYMSWTTSTFYLAR